MGYTIVDIINKALDITARRRGIYVNVGIEKGNIPAVKILSKVLTEQLDKTAAFYERLKNETEESDVEAIDIATYDKIAFLINEFNKKIIIVDIKNARDFLEFSLSLEKDAYSLLVDIQGRFVKNTVDVNTKTYKILSEIINNKRNYIETLKNTMK